MAAWVAAGCVTGGFQHEPSELGLTAETRAELDALEPGPETMEVLPIPYLSPGFATSRSRTEGLWCLLYLRERELGRLDRGYAYQTASLLIPFLAGANTGLYGQDGKPLASRETDVVGLYWPFPFFDVATFSLETANGTERQKSHWDFAVNLLRLPFFDTALIGFGSAKLDLLFLPLWRKDRGAHPAAE